MSCGGTESPEKIKSRRCSTAWQRRKCGPDRRFAPSPTAQESGRRKATSGKIAGCPRFQILVPPLAARPKVRRANPCPFRESKLTTLQPHQTLAAQTRGGQIFHRRALGPALD